MLAPKCKLCGQPHFSTQPCGAKQADRIDMAKKVAEPASKALKRNPSSKPAFGKAIVKERDAKIEAKRKHPMEKKAKPALAKAKAALEKASGRPTEAGFGILVRVQKPLLEQIDAVLKDGETRPEFLRRGAEALVKRTR